MTNDFEPKIIAFVCTYCTYAGADLAGTSRLNYPSNVRIIKLPCTGRISPMFILKALQKGADGVLISGCHPGDCHFTSGNLHARRRWAVFRSLLNFVGIPNERIRVTWISAAEGEKFADTVSDFTAELKKMGPFKLYQEMISKVESPADI